MIEAQPSNTIENEIVIDSGPEELTEYQRGISDGFNSVGGTSPSSKSLRIYCFACHRMEYHYSALKGKAYHHLLIGLTFGLALVFGPYRCRCCGYRRYVRYDFLNPRFHYHKRKYSKIKLSAVPVKESTRESTVSNYEIERIESDDIPVLDEFDSDLEPELVVETIDDSIEPIDHSVVEPVAEIETIPVVEPVPVKRVAAVVPQAAKRPAEKQEPENRVESESAENGNEDGSGKRRRRRRKRSKTLKTVPVVDSIRKAREERLAQEQVAKYASAAEPSGDFSIDGLMGSFETPESRKVRQEELAKKRAEQPAAFVGRKPRRRKKTRKPKRRYAKKERLTGPELYCFNCKQEIEHFHSFAGTGYYFFLFGISFGLVAIFGPYRCSTCDKKRLSRWEFLNPKYHIREMLARKGGYG